MSEGPVKVVVAGTLFPPYHTGAGRRILGYAPGLAARGVSLSVVSATPTPARAKAAGIPPVWSALRPGAWLPPEAFEGVEIRRVRLSDTLDRRRTVRFVAALAGVLVRERPDVLLLLEHSLEHLPLIGLGRAVGTATAIAYTLVLTRGQNPLRRAVEERVWPLVFEGADGVVVGSRALETSLRDFGVRRPVDVIPSGVLADRFRPCVDAGERARIRATLGIPEGRRVLLAVGAVSARKGADLLIDAFDRLAAEHPTVDLHFAGPFLETSLGRGPVDFNERIVARARAFGGRVRLLGQTDTVADLMRVADVFVLGSVREGLPNAVLEAMASGCPVFATRFMGLEGDDSPPPGTLCVTPRNAEALALAVGAHLHTPEAGLARAEAARRWVLDVHSRERTLDTYADFFHRLAGR